MEAQRPPTVLRTALVHQSEASVRCKEYERFPQPLTCTYRNCEYQWNQEGVGVVA